MYDIEITAKTAKGNDILSAYAHTREWPPCEATARWHAYLFSRGKYYLTGAHIYFSDFEADHVVYTPPSALKIHGNTCSPEDISYFREHILSMIA